MSGAAKRREKADDRVRGRFFAEMELAIRRGFRPSPLDQPAVPQLPALRRLQHGLALLLDQRPAIPVAAAPDRIPIVSASDSPLQKKHDNRNRRQSFSTSHRLLLPDRHTD